jgi:hypothetical protein
MYKRNLYIVWLKVWILLLYYENSASSTDNCNSGSIDDDFPNFGFVHTHICENSS